MNPQSIFFILLLGTMYGSNVLSARFAISQFDSVTFTALRLTITFLLFFAFYAFRINGRRLPTDRALWKHSLLMGIFYDGLPIALFISGLQFLSSGVATALNTLYPATVALMAHFFIPEEPLTIRKIFGITIALSGAVLMISLGETGLPDLERANPAGYLFILVCILVASGATIYVRKNLIHYDTFDVASIRMFSASTLLIIFGFFWSGLDTTRVILSGYIILLVGGVSSFFIALVNFYTIKRFGASKTSMADYFTLVVASIGGMVLFHEKFTPGILAGIVLILCGVIMINTVSTTPVKSHETAS